MMKKRMQPALVGGSPSSSLDTIKIMLQQEVHYRMIPSASLPSTSLDKTPTTTTKSLETCIQSMSDIFHLCRLQHKETLIYAVSYLTQSLPSEKDYPLPLWAMVCFYVAIKIHEPAALPLKSLPDLYQRFFITKKSTTSFGSTAVSVSEIQKCELDLYQALQWHLYPPTAFCFCRQFFFILASDADAEAAALSLLDRAFDQDPIAFVCDYPASLLARAAVEVISGNTTSTTTTVSQDPSCRLDQAMSFLTSKVVAVGPYHIYPIGSNNSKRKRCVSPPTSSPLSPTAGAADTTTVPECEDDASSRQQQQHKKHKTCHNHTSSSKDSDNVDYYHDYSNSPRSALAVTSEEA